ncbi:hypothetical protein BGW38_000298 [Lunasporangiospora selenospora]|uniref:RING-type domain-containing protein n=1 Tax=Lunasporangiospora selenospora TaxID=979761 RepID=A0A9P6FVU4_9FUNG|nr:hypothetical protein BGW38_000298 [Lunasporangiospora selenospora]
MPHFLPQPLPPLSFIPYQYPPPHTPARHPAEAHNTHEPKRAKVAPATSSFKATAAHHVPSIRKAEVLDLTLDSSDDEISILSAPIGLDILPSASSSSSNLNGLNGATQKQKEAITPGFSDSVDGKMPTFEDFMAEQKRLEEKKAAHEAELEQERKQLTNNFVGIAQDLFENISTSFLVKLMEDIGPGTKSHDELVEVCIERIFSLDGRYPRTKKRRNTFDNGSQEHNGKSLVQQDGDASSDEESDQEYVEDDPEGSRKKLKRDFMDCGPKMGSAYCADSAKQVYQDFPKLAATSIRTALQKHAFHYAPTYYYISNLWKELHESDGNNLATRRLIQELKTPRKLREELDQKSLDKDFKKEWHWVMEKEALVRAEVEKGLEEERNLQYYKDMNELIECGCCYDDVPPNRVSQCEEGHLFCFSCSRQGAEVELGYRRTVLKCMTAGCTSFFSDSEATKFLSKSVFEGLLRARQQNELKMAGLDSLVECPFCSYAAVVENDDDKEFRCLAPKCLKVSCRQCQAPTHIPLTCDEYEKELEKNNVLSAQHKVEEHMSEALIRVCPKCSARFFKTEGCNKMTCPECHTKMCYICKKQIRDYSHFDQTPADQTSNSKKPCRLWDNTVERNESEVKEAGARMLAELQTNKPDVAAKVNVTL